LQDDATIFYSLDSRERILIKNITVSEDHIPENPPVYVRNLVGNLSLNNLSEGWHKISVFAEIHQRSQSYNSQDNLDFFVDTAPTVSLLSFNNRTFESSDIPLNFTVDQPTMLIQYDLDELGNRTISSNTTLQDLPDGNHTIAIYAWDTSGNIGTTETINFTIILPKPSVLKSETSLFPILPVTATISIAVIIAVSLLFYLKKHKNNMK
jgi:hypothetical protein